GLLEFDSRLPHRIGPPGVCDGCHPVPWQFPRPSAGRVSVTNLDSSFSPQGGGRSCGIRESSQLSSRPTPTRESTMASDTSHAPPTSHSPPTTPVAPPVPAPSRRLPRLVRWAVWCAAAGIAIVAAYFGILWWTYREPGAAGAVR